MSLPVLFISHRTPDFAINTEEGKPLRILAKSLPEPQNILIISSYWQTRIPSIGTTSERDIRFDFPIPEDETARLYKRIIYPATRAPLLAEQLHTLLKTHYPVVARKEKRKLDHGAWIPLLHLYPSADIPVLQISLPEFSQNDLISFGKILAPLRKEGSLIVLTGNLEENLDPLFIGIGASGDTPDILFT